MSGKRGGLAWLVIAGLLAFLIAGGLKAAAKKLPWSFEEHVAHLVGDPTSMYPACHPKTDAEAALNKLIQRLFPLDAEDRALPLHVEFVHAQEVNAFAYLHGDIFVFSGLLQQARSAEELAGILAHEIEHVKQRHLVQNLFSRLILQIGWAWISGDTSAGELMKMVMATRFTRAQETEADEGAFRRLHDQHIDLSGVENFFARMHANSSGVSDLLSDHPDDASRARMAAKYKGGETTPVLSAREWLSLKDYCGAD